MAIDLMNMQSALARRELRRDEMTQYGGELAWLADPALIPDHAREVQDFQTYGPYVNAAVWTLTRLVEWSMDKHRHLDFAGVFNKYDLDSQDRAMVRGSIGEMAYHAYGPGMLAMSSLVEIVPSVATREGVSRDRWGELASKARGLGKKLSQNGTSSQAVLRNYWGNDQQTATEDSLLNSAKFRLDDEGNLTSVTPIDELVETATQLTDTYMVREEHSGICVALQANIEVAGKKVTMFDAVWDAYVSYIDRAVYPGVEVVEALIPKVEGADAEAARRIEDICRAQIEEWSAAGQ